MTNQPRILAFAGSAREASFNKKLVQIAAREAKSAGAEVTYIDLADYPMPLFDEDLEAKDGLPQAVLELKRLMKGHQGFLIACPEYNSSITPLLKNAIDWVSRPEPGEAPMALSCFAGKVAAIIAASPGGLGGLRGLSHVRSILENIGVLVIPEQKAIGNAFEAFDENGNLIDVKHKEAIAMVSARLTEITAKLNVDTIQQVRNQITAYDNAVLDDIELQEGLKQINPKFGDFVTRVAGEAWGLPLIDQKTKALVTIAVDIVNQEQVGPGNPFGAHVNMALKQGATIAEIEELLLFMCVYAGFNKAAGCFGVLNEMVQASS